MQTIFGCGVATGRFVMGSGEPLGQPSEQEAIDVDNDAPPPTKDDCWQFLPTKSNRQL
jgi:hypothetical protein